MAKKKKRQSLPEHLVLRGKTYWYWRMLNGESIRFSLKTTDLEIAILSKDAYEAAHVRHGLGLPEKREPLNFDQGWALYEKAVGSKKSAKCLANEKTNWFQLSQICHKSGVVTLDQVTPTDILEWQDSLVKETGKGGQHRKAITVNGMVHRGAGVVWSRLAKLERVEGNPFRKVDRLPEPEVDTKSIPWASVKALLSAAKDAGRDIHLLFVLGALGGMRKGELLRARWEDVKWDEGTLWVRGTKSVSSAADIPLHPDLRAALAEYRQESGYIVRPDLKPSLGIWTYRWDFQPAWDVVEAAAGVGHASPHMLRHSVAQQLFNTGHPIQEVARFLRHANGSYATMAYAKVKNVPVNIIGSLG